MLPAKKVENGDVTTLRANPTKSRRVAIGSAVTIGAVVVLICIIAFMVKDYNTAANGLSGAREGVWAVFKTALFIGGAAGLHLIVAWLVPAYLKVPWTVVLGVIAAWFARGFIDGASALPGGTEGIGTGYRILFLLVVLLAGVGLTVWRLLFKKDKPHEQDD